MIINGYSASFTFQISQVYAQLDSPIQEIAPEETPPASVEPDPMEDYGKKKLRGENGVLRLLQEDHFKGNAEMRLREIFHRELAILNAANAPEQDAAPVAENDETGDSLEGQSPNLKA